MLYFEQEEKVGQSRKQARQHAFGMLEYLKV
jgi:hypothetical protein